MSSHRNWASRAWAPPGPRFNPGPPRRRLAGASLGGSVEVGASDRTKALACDLEAFARVCAARPLKPPGVRRG